MSRGLGSPAGIPGFPIGAAASLAAGEPAGLSTVDSDGSVSSRAAVSSRSSALRVHRHASCSLASPLIPSLRARSQTPLPRKIAAATVVHRTPREDRRDRMTPATRNGGRVAGSRNTNSIPPVVVPPPIDGCTKRCVMTAASAISRIAPILSNHGARLKKSHQRRMSAAPAAPTTRPIKPPPGTNGAMTKRANTTMMAPATPGQRRSDFSLEDSGPAVAIVNYSVPERPADRCRRRLQPRYRRSRCPPVKGRRLAAA